MSMIILILIGIGFIVALIILIGAGASFFEIFKTLFPYVIIFYLILTIRSNKKRIQNLEDTLLEKKILNEKDLYDIKTLDEPDDD